MVTVESLSKRYGAVTVVDGVSFGVARGEVLGILGANGAGKTTTVECIQGLRVPDGGSITVCDLDPLRDRAELVARVGSQLQQAALPDRLRVEEAIRFFSGPCAMPVDDVLETWGLGAQRRSAFATLSGGQQQRLFVALALLNRPEVVFLDELTQGLDPHARRVVWDLVAQLRRDGTTIVLVTHFLDEAAALCDRILVMRHGRVVADDTPAGLLASSPSGATLRFTPPDESTRQAVASLPGLRHQRSEGDVLVLEGDTELIAHVGAALVAAGTIPADLRVEQTTLEDVLLPLIGDDG